MIDWDNTKKLYSTSPRSNCKDKVIVICEKCGYSRPQTYSIAKQKDQHVCMSCVKTKDYPTWINIEKTKQLGNLKIQVGKPVVMICSSCKQEIQVILRRKSRIFRCSKCILKENWEKGLYKPPTHKISDEEKKLISESAKLNWKRHEYRDKWKESRNKSREHRSEVSKKLWSDPGRKQRLSVKIKSLFDLRSSYYSRVMEARKSSAYREAMSKTIKELWDNPEYRSKVEAVLGSTEHRALLSESAKELWKDLEYRKLYQTKEWSEKSTKSNSDRWANNRELLMKTFSSDAFRIKMAKICINQPKTSSQQIILYSILDDLKIVHHKDDNDLCRIGYYCFDCRIDPQDGINLSRSLLIEVQGDYWHNLPKAVARDKSKSTYLKTYFPDFDLKYLWEHEFDNKDRIVNLIKYWLGLKPSELIDFTFKDIQERVVDFKEAELFISKYHYASRVGRSGVNLGYYLGDILVGVIVYSTPIRQEVASKQGRPYREVLELSRLAIHPDYQVKNLASYLISKSVNYIRNNQSEIKCLVSFADMTHNHSGTVYKASNWKLDGEVAPDYWYADDRGYICHKKTLWNKAKKM